MDTHLIGLPSVRFARQQIGTDYAANKHTLLRHVSVFYRKFKLKLTFNFAQRSQIKTLYRAPQFLMSAQLKWHGCVNKFFNNHACSGHTIGQFNHAVKSKSG